MSNSRNAVLDFDGWTQSLPAGQQAAIRSQLEIASDKEAEKRHIANILWISERAKLPAAQVARNYDATRAAFSTRAGWAPETYDPVKFHGQVLQEATKERDEETMLIGKPGDTEDAIAARESSMFGAAWNAGTSVKEDGEGGGMAFAKWQEAAKNSPSYRPQNAERYYFQFMQQFSDGQAEARVARDAAQQALPVLLNAEGRGDVNISEAVPFFRGLSANQKALAVKYISDAAEMRGSLSAGDGMGEQSMTAIGRGILNTLGSIDRGFARDRLSSLKFEAGQSVPDGADNEVISSFMTSGNPGKPLVGDGNLTAERAAALNAQVKRRLDDLQLESELIQLAQGKINPLSRQTWQQKMVIGASESIGAMGIIATPVGLPAMINAYRTDAEEKLVSSGIPLEKARGMSMVIGAAQGALDRVSLGLLKKMPGLNNLLSKWSTNGVLKAIGRTAGVVAGETAIELTQDQVVPALVQDVANMWDSSIPDVSWSKVGKEAWAQTPDTLLAILPLALLGAGGATLRDMVDANRTVNDPVALEALGFSPSHIAAISLAADIGDGVKVFKELWKERTPKISPGDSVPASPIPGEPSNSVPEASAMADTTGETSLPVDQSPDPAIITPEQIEPEPAALRRDDHGWKLVFPDGREAQAGSLEAAEHMRSSLRRATSEKEALAMVGLADEIAARSPNTTQVFSSDVLKVDEGDVTRVKLDGSSEAVTFETKTASNLNAQLAHLGATSGLIQGSNWIRQDGQRILESNQTRDGVFTQVHEFAESRFRDIIAQDGGALAVQAARVAVNTGLFNPEKQRTPEDRKFAESLRNIANGKTTETEARETLVELAVSDALGRRREGRYFSPGVIADGVSQMLRGNLPASMRRTLSGVMALLKAARAYVQGVFSVAAKLKRARREGKIVEGDALTTLLDQMLGVPEQRRHNEAVLKESGLEDGASFSFAGERSSVPAFMIDSLDAARDMAAAGRSSEEIRALTGWFPGKYDGMMRWEIPDEGAFIKGTKKADELLFEKWATVTRKRNRTAASAELQDVLRHPKLFEAYPEAQSIQVITGNRAKGSFVSNMPGFSVPVIQVQKNLAGDELKSTILHEIQHWIQEKEGFAKGSSPDAFPDGQEINDAQVIQNRIAAGMSPSDAAKWFSEKLGRTASVKAMDLATGRPQDLRRLAGGPESAYRRTAGEIEARDVQARQRMSAAQRSAVEPYSSENIAKEDAIMMTGSAGATFDLASESVLETIARRMEEATPNKPEARLTGMSKAAENLKGIQRAWLFNDSVNGPFLRTQAAVERQRKEMRKTREAELLQKVEEDFGNTDEIEFLASPTNSPVLSELFRKRIGDRFPRSRIATRPKDYQGRDYDGAKEFPAWLFGGTEQPNTLAQELADDGKIRDGYPDTMWAAIELELSSSAKRKETLKQYRERVAEAKQQARDEANAWAESQNVTAEDAAAQKKEVTRSLVALDGILMAAPAEVRGKVGGFVALSKLTTDAARLRFLLGRVDKMVREYEKWLRGQYTDNLEKLIDRANDTSKPGEKARGAIGPQAHRFFAAVGEVVGMSAAQVEAKQAELENELTRPREEGEADLTDDEAANIFEKQQVLDLFGNLKDKNAAELAKAYEAAQTVYKEGRNRWRIAEETRLTEVRAIGDGVIAALGGAGYKAIQGSKENARSLKAKANSIRLELKNLGGFLKEILGENNEIATRWTSAARNAMQFTETARRGLKDEWKAKIEEATGKKGRAARLEVWNMVQNQSIDVVLAGAAKSSTRTVPESVLENIMDGTVDPRDVGLTRAQADELIGQAAGKPLEVKDMSRGPSENVKLTESEGIFITMLAAQEQYEKGLDAAGFTGDAITAIEESLSPAAKTLRAWMRGKYADNYKALNSVFSRMFGVDLAQIENYAPAAFYHTGDANAKGPEDSTMQEGGFRSNFLKTRKKHRAAPRLENAFAAFFGHAAQSAHWQGFAELVREMRGVMSRPDVKMALEGRHGREVSGLMSDWLKNIEGNGISRAHGALDAFTGWLLRQAAYVHLAYNVGTLVAQSTAALGAAWKIGAGQYMRGLGKLMTGRLDLKAMWNSDLIQNRLANGYAPEVRAALNDLWSAKPSRQQDFLEKGMELIGFVDAFWTTGSAAIAYDAHYRDAIDAGMSEESAKAIAMARTEETVGETAQPSTITEKSLFEAKQGNLAKLAFLYASESRQKTAMLVAAWKNAFTLKATRQDVQVLVLAHLIIGPLLQFMRAALRDMKDDDDEEVFDKKHWQKPGDWIGAMLLGPLNGIPLVGDLFSGYASDNAAVGRFKEAGSSAISMLKGPEAGTAEKGEWYWNRVVRALKGLDAATAVTAGVADQVFKTADNFSE